MREIVAFSDAMSLGLDLLESPEVRERTVCASSNPWFEIFHNRRFTELFEALYRVLAPNRHCYLFCDAETMLVAKPIAEQCGFKFWKPIVWDKKWIGMGYHYRARYEFILFFEKGKRKLNYLGISDIIEEPQIHKSTTATQPKNHPPWHRSSLSKAPKSER